MADLGFADILRGDAQVGARTVTEVRQQALDGRHRAEGIVAEADGEHGGADLGEGLAIARSGQPAAAGTAFIAWVRGGPVADHAGGCVLHPAQALAGEVAVKAGQQGHQHMPFAQHAPA